MLMAELLNVLTFPVCVKQDGITQDIDKGEAGDEMMRGKVKRISAEDGRLTLELDCGEHAMPEGYSFEAGM